MSPDDLNTIGLFFNLAGVALAFFFGFPHTQDTQEQKTKHIRWSKAGLAMMFIGFTLQLSSIWVASAHP